MAVAAFWRRGRHSSKRNVMIGCLPGIAASIRTASRKRGLCSLTEPAWCDDTAVGCVYGHSAALGAGCRAITTTIMTRLTAHRGERHAFLLLGRLHQRLVPVPAFCAQVLASPQVSQLATPRGDDERWHERHRNQVQQSLRKGG